MSMKQQQEQHSNRGIHNNKEDCKESKQQQQQCLLPRQPQQVEESKQRLSMSDIKEFLRMKHKERDKKLHINSKSMQ